MAQDLITIVGGRSIRSRGRNDAPRGVEILLKKAKVDPHFRALLEKDAVAAASSIGLEFSDTEKSVLASTPAVTLRTMVEHTFVPRHHVRTFLTRNAAAMLALVLASTVLQPTRASGGVEVKAKPQEAQEVTLQELAIDRMGVVQQALEEFKRVHRRYPSTEEWYLGVHPLADFVPRTYLFDSWKRPLRYMGVVQDGSVTNYRLETNDGPIKYVCPFDQEQHRFFGSSPLTILVPKDGARLRSGLLGSDARAETRLRANHTKTGVSVAWFLDGEKIATTHDSHEVTTRVSPGSHHLLIVDDRGYSDNASFSVTKAE